MRKIIFVKILFAAFSFWVFAGCASTPKPRGLDAPIYGPGSASDPELMRKDSYARHKVQVFDDKYSKISGTYYSDNFVKRYYRESGAMESLAALRSARIEGYYAGTALIGGLVLGAAAGAWASLSYMERTNAARDAGIGAIGVFILYLAGGELVGAGVGACLGKLASIPFKNNKRQLRNDAAEKFNVKLARDLGLGFEMEKNF